ncbi:MAG: phosphoenolpyruvate--protein phosphotransferase [Deltaproteobacteria bacterium RIFCSPLOWO2_12_FULL_60_19]|nr:MAG: phosphoenolpyruvate--protein phosphotransferase [Deltaproteobacteria bacterium RIFCSPLOWO2_12_FULL_60_19]
MARAKKFSRRSRSHLLILEDISTLVSHSQDLQETLKNIVAIVAERMETEVCSLYILDPKKNRLTLCATMGLDQESVGKVSMGISEGLTGLVIQQMKPVIVVDAQAHPRYKYFPETGEERYHSFLGVPLIEQKEPRGVLVVQTSRRRKFSRDEIRLLKAISAQASSIIIQARLIDSLKDKERERKEYRKGMVDALRRLRSYEGKHRESIGRGATQRWRGRLAGLSVSPGFGRGNAYVLKPRLNLSSVKEERAKNPKHEIERFRGAVERGIEQIQNLKQRMSQLISKEEGALFDVHRLILEDPTMIEQAETKIRKERYTAEYAVSSVFEQHLDSFSRIEDEYLRERAADVKDVAQRLLENLSGTNEEKPVLPKGAVLVAEDLSPADLSLIEGDHFRGIVLATGGATSHASILAKSFEIPSVVAVEGVMENVRAGDSLIVDGNSGVVYINPSHEVVREYDRLERDYQALNKELNELHDSPAETQDGRRVALYANVGLLSDIAFAHLHGAQGIGLYRTEIPFLTHRDFPSEEEQFALYRRVVEGMDGKPITIRTLDIGADKYPAYMRRATVEPNPFLGWRSIRVSLEMTEIFKAQLRAILRVGALGRVRLLIPMVTSLEEVLKVKEILAEVKDELERNEVPFDRRMELGVMVEVPSAVHLASRMLREVDFLSIGTNDLIQYILAVDRSNHKVAGLYEPLHPAVLAALTQTIEAARIQGKRVGMCGEMAGDPLCTLLLLGMGLEEFSMGSLYIPVVKRIIRSVAYQEAKTAAQIALQMDTVGEIKKYLFEQMRDLGLVELLELYH